MKNINIYIVHNEDLKTRLGTIDNIKNKLKNLEKKYNINYNIITDYHVNDLTNERLANIVKLEKITDTKYEKYNNFLRNLTPQSLSKTLKHFKCFQEIKKNKDDDFNIVFEDDIVIEDDNFYNNLDTLLGKFKNIDIAMLGIPSSLEHIDKDTYKFIDSKLIYNTIPGNDSYIISAKCANKLVKSFIPITFELNIQLNYVCEKNDIKIMQASPNIIVEGSKIGKYKSTTNINNAPIYNIKYKDMNSLIVKPVLDANDIIKLKNLWDDDFLKDNPDFDYLKALYYFKNERYEESKTYFDKVYNAYINLGLTLNKESNFLNNYTEIFKFVQT